MAVQTQSVAGPGARLADMLVCYRQFVQNIFALVRYIEGEATRRDWVLIRPGGYQVTRNGWGSGLANFETADWVPSHFGIGFVQPGGNEDSTTGPTNTAVPEGGLDVLFFQVRFLEKSPEEPSLWFGTLRVTPEGEGDRRRWEDFQTQVFKRLEHDKGSAPHGSSRIRQFRIARGRAAVNVSGEYSALPLTALLNEQDVVTKVVLPVFGEQQP